MLKWFNEMCEKVGDNVMKEEFIEFVWVMLKSGRVVLGYGYGVLRKTDSRYTC